MNRKETTPNAKLVTRKRGTGNKYKQENNNKVEKEIHRNNEAPNKEQRET